MKKTILMLLALAIVAGCRKNEGGGTLPVQVDMSKIEFTPIAGGAIMKYVLPADGRVYGIKATFTSAVTGDTETVIGTYGGTEVALRGFIEPQSAVRARLSLIGLDGSESKATEATFPTLAASALSVFDEIEVTSFWSGFSVGFDADEGADGFVNVGYMGIDPVTSKPGVILKATELIRDGRNKLNFAGIPDKNGMIEAVVWTEDFAGNEVMRKTFEVSPYIVVQHDRRKMSYTGNSVENPDRKFGSVYLFDGDTKGIQSMQVKGTMNMFLFATQDSPELSPEGVIDLGEPQLLAQLRMYAMLNSDVSYPSVLYNMPASPDTYYSNNFKLWASNDKATWVEIGEVYQEPATAQTQRWDYPAFNPGAKYTSVEQLEAADPCWCEVNFDVLDTTYRYIRIQFISNFKLPASYKRTAVSEIEVYVKG